MLVVLFLSSTSTSTSLTLVVVITCNLHWWCFLRQLAHLHMCTTTWMRFATCTLWWWRYVSSGFNLSKTTGSFCGDQCNVCVCVCVCVYTYHDCHSCITCVHFLINVFIHISCFLYIVIPQLCNVIKYTVYYNYIKTNAVYYIWIL